jgi:hypothetical protein
MAACGQTLGRWGGILGLLLGLAACTHGGGEPARAVEELLPAPDDPTYAQQVLQRRTELLRAIADAQFSLDRVRYLIDLRENRDFGGRMGMGGELMDLRRTQLEREFDLMRAQGALTRLERRVRQDHGGALPPWWPRE